MLVVVVSIIVIFGPSLDTDETSLGPPIAFAKPAELRLLLNRVTEESNAEENFSLC